MISAFVSLVRRHTRLLRFLISGGMATMTNLLVVFVFTDMFQVFYLVSSGVAFVSSFLVSFMLQKFWTFGDHTLNVAHRQLVISLMVAGFNLLVNTLLMYVFVECVGFHYLLGQICSSAIIACETFFVYRYVIFVPNPGIPNRISLKS